VVGLVETAGATPYFVDPVEHDSYVAAVSHLPLLLSTALVACAARSPAWREMGRLAASGFRDVSRLASGDPTMHKDICLTNRQSILYWVEEFTQQLSSLRDLVKEGSEELEQAFANARGARAQWMAGGIAPRSPALPKASERLLDLFLGERLAQRVREATRGPEDPEGRLKKG
jgi:prephenate dehydrogenase